MIDCFWEQVKRRTIARYGTLEKAFRQVDTSGDGVVSCIEFSSLLRNVGISLESRFLRSLFDKASDGDREMSFDEQPPRWARSRGC